MAKKKTKLCLRSHAFITKIYSNFGGFGPKWGLSIECCIFGSHGSRTQVPKAIRPCAKPHLLMYCTQKSVAAFSKNLLDPLSVTYDLEKQVKGQSKVNGITTI